MKNLKNSKTYENLARAFAGECQAHVRYMFIEYGARNEGYVALSEIIDKVVYEEFNHARMLYSFLQTADENVIKNIDISAGFLSNKNGISLTTLHLPRKTKKTRRKESIPNLWKPRKRKDSRISRGFLKTLFRLKPATKNSFSTCTSS